MGDPFPNVTMIDDDDYDDTTTVLEPGSNLDFIPNNNVIFALQKPLEDEEPMRWSLPDTSEETAIESENIGVKALGDKEIFEENVATVPVNSPSYRHQHAISATIEGRKKSNRGFIEVRATIHLAMVYNYTKSPGRNTIGEGPSLNLPDTMENIRCNFNSRYRKIDGTCNNKEHPRKFGAAMTPFRRFV